ncbi:hypothetical protein [Dendronalium sp. ChiSLP03b]|uniref:hypothetical protein n=1 Tax=Dendronalium sp. ChiSLP03b TaxID=3075381 RepID=UPI002AD4E5E9|nr:hypothetical protein [Dendronalium sp. ChiSLP03b]MDZ8204130.1 hypothetical protein [Dendronalium sp. ChiSLP03b]
MEHWQFLIQKQGDRSWHVLESPNLEILEGWYRVLARSNLPHTDVEVRVTHSSTCEVPPKRRIQKRSRRTNSEGLMAVIPFTHLKSGIWQLRCSGDLMSDILGKSWQYSIHLQVLSQPVDEAVVGKLGTGESVLNVPAHPDFVSYDNLISAAVTPELITAQNNSDTTDLLADKKEAVIGNLESTVVTTEAMSEDKPQSFYATPNNAATTDLLADKKEAVIGNLESTVVTTEAMSEDKPQSVYATPNNAATTDLLADKEEAVIGNLESTVMTTQAMSEDKPQSVYATPNNAATTDLFADKEEAVIDQPVSPVWLKGETTEQILQNLIDLALPVSESLLEDENAEDSPAIQPAPPLLLTLERENYIARWGQTLSISGRVELQDKTNLESYTINPENLHALELRIELRSPLAAEILNQVRQPLPDKLLPFTINSSINIPADCESKLILADISLFGALANVGEVMLLASQSFTITADVTELLAIATTTKSNQLNLLDEASTSPMSAATREPATSIRLDLQLFNLVKTAKTTQIQPIHSFPNKPLPLPGNPEVPQEAIRVSKLNKSGDLRSPQLPKLPETQTTKAVATDAVLTDVAVTEPSLQESVEKKYITTPIAPINLEQLVIRNNRVSMLSNTFPYLKRLKTLPDDKEEVKNHAPEAFDASEFQATEDSPQMEPMGVVYENAPELASGDGQSQDDSVAEVAVVPPTLELINDAVAEVAVIPPSSELIDNSMAEMTVVPPSSEVQLSPLIRKWMQSQGYTLPESVYLQYQDDVLNYQTMPDKQAPLSDSSQTPADDLNLSSDLNLETEIGSETDLVEVEEIDIQEHSQTETPESFSTEAATDLPIGDRIFAEEEDTENSFPNSSPPEVPPASHIKTPAWLAQEIVVDDTYSEITEDTPRSYPSQEKELPISDLAGSLPLSAAIAEPLSVPQLHVPDSELIAGESVRVRVELPEVSPQVVIKLWIEDCQTRALLDGPHLLRDLLPSSSGGLEAMTQLSIPFGCLEIRIEAIALDMATQQESHKVTIVRTVIPPDLPNLQLDELLGMDI